MLVVEQRAIRFDEDVLRRADARAAQRGITFVEYARLALAAQLAADDAAERDEEIAELRGRVGALERRLGIGR